MKTINTSSYTPKLLFKLLVIVLSTTPPEVAARESKITLKKNYKTYTVGGNSIKDIDRSFDNYGDSDIQLDGFDAETSYSYQFSIDDENCKTENFSLSVNYTLPQLYLDNKYQSLGEQYRSYLTALYEHEEIHCAISLEAMHQIKLLANLGQESKEACLESISKIKTIEATFDSIHEDFDEATEHGKNPEKSTLGKIVHMNACKIEKEPIMYW